jgi:hypothetical protein
MKKRLHICTEMPCHQTYGSGLLPHVIALLLVALCFLYSVSIQAGTLFVDRDHPEANDTNAGTEAFPWKTIVHAARVAGAGDTVLIKKGIYQDGDVWVENSGAPGREIIFMAYPGHERQAVIKGGAFRSTGNSHIIVRNLKILESPSYGFRFEGPVDPGDPPATNITISGNHTHDTCSSGISIWGVKWGEDPGDYDNIRDVVIEENLLELGTHGCKSEIITVANGAVNVVVRNNEIRLGDPAMEGGDEGIDFKEGVRDSRIHGNYIHHLSDKAIYIDGGSDPHDPQITNIHIYDNIMMHLPSAGISIVTEGKGDVDGIYVYNNIVAHVDGDGFIVYDHPGGRDAGGTVKNVHFINNTAVDTGLTKYGGGFRVNHERATGIVFRNNIAWNNDDYDMRGEAETLIESNLCAESFCEVQEDPGFLDPQEDDFRLQTHSPAIDRGLFQGSPDVDILGTARPQGAGPDLGAYEFRNQSVPGPGPATLPVPDTEIPSVTITTPVGGVVSGNVTVSVEAEDNAGIETVSLYIDGAWIDEDRSAPYVFTWDSTGHTGGDASIEARAFDSSSNMGSHSVQVIVDNQSIAPITVAAVTADASTTVGGGSGGGCSLSASNAKPLRHSEWWLLLALLACRAMWRYKKPVYSHNTD